MLTENPEKEKKLKRDPIVQHRVPAASPTIVRRKVFVDMEVTAGLGEKQRVSGGGIGATNL